MTAFEQGKFRMQVLLDFLVFRLNRFCLYDREKLVRLQKRRLKKLWRQLEASPFYRPYSNDSWGNLPLINKEVFMDRFDEINTRSIEREEAMGIALNSERTRDFSPTLRGVTVGLSSGTSGNRGLFLASPAERAKWVAAMLDRVIGFRWQKRRVAFFLRANNNLYESVRSRLLQFEFFDTSVDLNEHHTRLGLLQPDILIGQPSVLRELAGARERRELDTAPDQIISVAEVLTEEDRDYLSSVFGRPIDQVYQCTEGFLAHSCEEGNLHFNEDFLLIERKYVDVERRRFHPIVTDLFRITQPVIRYELNDVIQEGAPCPCGRVTMRIEQIEGRSDDAFRFTRSNGTEGVIFPDTIRRAVIRSTDAIREYTVRQTEPDCVYFSIETRILEEEVSSGQSVKSALDALFKAAGWKNVQVMQESAIPLQKGEKLRRIKNQTRSSI